MMHSFTQSAVLFPLLHQGAEREADQQEGRGWFFEGKRWRRRRWTRSACKWRRWQWRNSWETGGEEGPKGQQVTYLRTLPETQLLTQTWCHSLFHVALACLCRNDSTMPGCTDISLSTILHALNVVRLCANMPEACWVWHFSYSYCFLLSTSYDRHYESNTTSTTLSVCSSSAE